MIGALVSIGTAVLVLAGIISCFEVGDRRRAREDREFAELILGLKR